MDEIRWSDSPLRKRGVTDGTMAVAYDNGSVNTVTLCEDRSYITVQNTPTIKRYNKSPRYAKIDMRLATKMFGFM